MFQVAVKVVPKKAVLVREFVRKNVRREAIVLQKLSHPNIIKMYEVMETENSYYLVLEYADCGEFIKYLSIKWVWVLWRHHNEKKNMVKYGINSKWNNYIYISSMHENHSTKYKT